MMRMRAMIWIIVFMDMGKGVVCISGAAGSFVNVKTEDRTGAFLRRKGKTGYFCGNNDTGSCLKELHHSPDIWILIASEHRCNGSRMLPENGNGAYEWSLKHKFTWMKYRYNYFMQSIEKG